MDKVMMGKIILVCLLCLGIVVGIGFLIQWLF